MLKSLYGRIFLVILSILLNSCVSIQVTPAPTFTSAPPPTITPASASPAPTNARTGLNVEKVVTLELPESFINTILFSPDGNTMVTGDRNGEALFWESGSWNKTVFLPARSTRAEDKKIPFWGTLVFCPERNTIIQAYGEEGVITGWDTSGEELFSFSYGSRVFDLVISPDGRLLVTGGMGGNLLLFDLDNMKQVADIPSDHTVISNLVFSPDGKTLLVNFRQPEPLVMIWRTDTWKVLETFTFPNIRHAPHDLVFSPDGKQLAVAHVEDPEIQYLDWASRQVVMEFTEHTRTSYQIAFSPDGSLLASAGDDGTVRLWDMRTNLIVKTIPIPSWEIGAVAFSPDGTLLVFSIWGKGLQVWSIQRSS